MWMVCAGDGVTGVVVTKAELAVLLRFTAKADARPECSGLVYGPAGLYAIEGGRALRWTPVGDSARVAGKYAAPWALAPASDVDRARALVQGKEVVLLPLGGGPLRVYDAASGELGACAQTVGHAGVFTGGAKVTASVNGLLDETRAPTNGVWVLPRHLKEVVTVPGAFGYHAISIQQGPKFEPVVLDICGGAGSLTGGPSTGSLRLLVMPAHHDH